MIDPNGLPFEYVQQQAGMTPGEAAERNRYMLQQYVEQLKQAERIKANPELMKLVRDFLREEQTILAVLIGPEPSPSPLDGIAIRVKRNGQWTSQFLNELSFIADSEIRELSWGDRLVQMLEEDPEWTRTELEWIRATARSET